MNNIGTTETQERYYCRRPSPQQMTMDELSRELLRYGFFVTDDEMADEGGETRTRVIEYSDGLYYHKMTNGLVVEVSKIEDRCKVV